MKDIWTKILTLNKLAQMMQLEKLAKSFNRLNMIIQEKIVPICNKLL